MPRHAVIHLPVLAPDEAVLVMRVLDRVIDAIWRAHGPAIEALAAARDDTPARPASAPRSSDGEIF
jgi:hypothetical protein